MIYYTCDLSTCRPNSICGTVLVMAFGVHNMDITIDDISAIVGISSETIVKKLQFLKNTNIA